MRCVDPLGEKMAKIWLKLQENGEKKSQMAKVMAKEKYILARTLSLILRKTNRFAKIAISSPAKVAVFAKSRRTAGHDR